jgi:hypothetical protein
MSQMSDYLENKLIDHLFRATAYTAPATLYVALLTSAANDASTGATIAEASYTNYARASLAASVANWKSTNGTTSGASSGTGGQTMNASTLTFGTTPGSGPTVVTHFAILDSATIGAGNVLFYGTLGASKTINASDPAPTAAADAVTVTLA